MRCTIWILLTLFHFSTSERAGSTHCSSSNVPTSGYSSGASGAAGTTDNNVLVQDETFMFQCCGVVSTWEFVAGSTSPIAFQVWRQTAEDAFTLISQSEDYTPTSGSQTLTVEDNKKISFQEGDLIGWRGTSGGEIIKHDTGTTLQFNRHANIAGTSAVGDTYNWNTASINLGYQYAVRATTAASTIPYFKTIPTTLVFADTSTLIGGIVMLTITFSDLDPDDVTGLSVTMEPEWDDYFVMDPATYVVTTTRKLEPLTYEPVFRIEESHCGQTATATLTVSVTDSAPSITNLPASATVHEDVLDETLLHTVTMTDPTNQPMWCEDTWDIGTSGANKPFAVKMLSTTGGSSQAGIYLIEWPKLDYGTNAFYSLTIDCYDTGANKVSGNFYVNIIENQKPIFSNMGNMVEIDANTTIIGTTIFTVATTDPDNDQITYTHTCTPVVDCPFTVLDNGAVVLTDSVYLYNTATYTLTITPSDLRSPITARDLVIYIINENNDPVLSNLPAATVSVEENVVMGTSLFQVSSTDADSTDTVTYYMTIDQAEGWGLFEMTSTGLVSTHSTRNIDFDILTRTTFIMTIYAHDGKEAVSNTLTITVTNQNEAIYFTQSMYSITDAEGSAGTQLADPLIDTFDLDVGDTTTFTMDCGSENSYFTLTGGRVSLALEYDLDATTLPQQVTCSLVVKDGGNINDTATLYIFMNYANDNTPTFSPSTYTLDVRSDTPLGASVLKLTATDADKGDYGVMTWTLTQTSLGGATYFVIQDGTIYANVLLTALATAGTKTLTVTATDSGGLVGVATVTITFIDATVVPITTTDRNYRFIEDPRNISWLVACILTIVACLLVVTFMVVTYCRGRDKSIFADCFTPPKPKRRRELDANRRLKPYGRQEPPLLKHVHAREILLPPPEVTTPVPVADTGYSIRPNSADSSIIGKVRISQVNLREEDSDVNAWMENNAVSTPSAAPERLVTRAKASDIDYIHRSAHRRTSSVGSMSNDSMFGPAEIVPNSSSGSLHPADRARAQQVGSPVRVSPSPNQWDNTIDTRGTNNTAEGEYDDDFMSERLSIASP